MKNYTCNDYRQEMILVGLKKQLADPGLSEEAIRWLREQIQRIEEEMGLD